MSFARALFVSSTLFAAAASAQVVTGLKVEPASVKPAEAVTATVSMDVPNGVPYCGMRLHWGDGTVSDHKINQTKDVPLVASHPYAAPGRYKVMAEPKRVGALFKCGGSNQEAFVDVVAAAAGASAATAAKPGAVASPCPAGWKLNKAGVNKKTKAFTCIAAANTAIPEPKASCPGDLTYFENMKKGQLGCRP